MPNSIITTAGLALFARAQAEGLTVTIDKMIFADVPGLDPEQTPDPAAGLPPAGQIVFEGAIENTGKIAPDTVVYSRILAATDGTFYLNWIGLYSTAYATLVAVCVVHRHQKYTTDGFRAGNTLYKNFAIKYANASALTGITIDAASWQYDLSTRYALKDHNHDERYEPKNAVATHNQAEDPHPGKFEAAGAVSVHNQAGNPHPGKFEAAGAVSAHNQDTNTNAHSALFSARTRYPDYSAGVDILAEYNVADAYTLTADGWILVVTRGGQKFYANGGMVADSSAEGDHGVTLFPVKTGDVLTGDTSPYNLIYYPNR